MGKLLKRFFGILFLVCFCLASEIPYLSQVESVQASSQRDKNVKKIVRLLSDGIMDQVCDSMSPNSECVFDFSKSSDCKVFITTSQSPDKINTSTFTKNVFGKKISGAKLSYGEWGNCWPVIKVTKMKKKGKKLVVSYKIYMYNCEDDEKDLMASGTMYLKKSKVSKYKYAVTKLSIKRNSFRGTWE